MKKKAYIIITLIFILGLFIGGCSTISTNAKEKSSKRVETYYIGEAISGGYDVYTIVDDKTGVNYLVLTRWNTGGEIAICPRYNADGSLYVSE